MNEENNCAFILTGSNMGNRLTYLCTALKELEHLGYEILNASKVYETAAWGNTEQQSFLNQCLHIKCPHERPHQLLEDILNIERQQGRTRNIAWGPRTLDIDIISFGNMIIKHYHLQVPHPHLADRMFALIPLHDVAPNWKHAITNESVATLINKCKDKLPVKIFCASACSDFEEVDEL